MNDKKWVRRTVRQIRKALKKQGYHLSRSTVWRLLKQLGYALRSNCKRFTGADQPERDRQLRYIGRVKQLFVAAGYPVISVDTKKKELIGNFKNAGRLWRQQADEVNVHDFRQEAVAKAVPYGIYDLVHNQGYVYVGTSADTAEFAVEAIVRWWTDPGRPRFAKEDKVLILCDAGGSNGYRLRLWKHQLQTRLADALGVEVMVCHYPTGASKWNPIEHRLFSYISLNWAGQPLRSLQLMLNYIRGTTTETGLKVKAFLVDQVFEKGRQISTQEMARLNLLRRRVCPKWNYVIRPRSA